MSVKTPIDIALESVDWKESGLAPTEDGTPYATHEGVFKVMGLSLRCYRLNDGRAIFNAEDMENWFGELL